MSKRKVIITEDMIEIYGTDGFEFHREHLGSCRDAARAAMTWAMMRLADDLHKDAVVEWDKQTSGIAD